MTRVKGWASTVEQRGQVKCLIASAGHLWMKHYFDRLPTAVRKRLTESRHNICPACLDEEARSRNLQVRPTVAVYLEVIEAIERQLEVAEEGVD
jgi:hypothetical protein